MAHIQKPWGKVKPPLGARLDLSDPITDRLRACWLMNEGGGATIYSVGPELFPGTFNGNASWANGDFGRTISLDGTNDYVNCGAVSRLYNLGAVFSLCAWANITDIGQDDYLISAWDGSNNRWALSRIGVNYVATDATQVSRSFATNPANNALYHICAVCDTNTATITVYQNGVVNQGAQTGTSTGTSSHAPRVFIGTLNTTFGSIGGRIDNVRLYNRALTPDEVSRLYTEPFAGIVQPMYAIGRNAVVAGAARPRLIDGRLVNDGLLLRGIAA